MRIMSFVPVLFVTLLLAACGGDDPTGPGGNEPGRFTAEVSGDRTATLDGLVAFGLSRDGLAVVMDDDGSIWDVVILRPGVDRPSPGTYLFGDAIDYPVTGEYVALISHSDGGFRSVSGELTITASSERRLAATFEITALGGAVTGEDEQITVSGSFNATPDALAGG